MQSLLNAARLQSGQLRPKLDWCDTSELVAFVLQEVGGLTGGHPVGVKTTPGLPLVKMDFVLMQQALINLLANAAMHTPHGTPIEISGWINAGELRIEVADRGPGLPSDQLERIFDLFHRAPEAKPGGTGFGIGHRERICGRAGGPCAGGESSRWRRGFHHLHAGGGRAKLAGGTIVNATSVQAGCSALVIDDEPQIQRLLTISLEANGYRVTTTGTGQEGLAIAAQRRHDVIILDLGLPDLDGLAVLKQLREWTQTPVVVLTVLDEEADKIEALDSGADDYVTKPFNSGELLARLRAAIRRADKGKLEEPTFRSGGLVVDLAGRWVTRDGQPVKLTVTEYALLRLFIQHAGKVLTHRHILREVWGREHEGDTQYLRVYMTRLREKLESSPPAAPLFVTEPGVGYRFKA